MSDLLEVTNLGKTYRVARRTGPRRLFRRAVEHEDVVAVQGVTFGIRAGEAVAYVGPNGAGKSTTIKLMTGITTASSGTVRLAGLDPARNRTAFARRVGVVFGQRTQLWPDMTVLDSFRLLQRVYDVPDADFEANLAAATDMMQVGKLLDRAAKRLSLGQRVQADITAAFLHSPQIVFLDEPTIGLDLEVKDQVRRFIAERIGRGTALVLTSHDLGDVERLCPRVMVIDDGTLLYDGDQQKLLETYPGERTMRVSLERPVDEALVVALDADAAGFSVRRESGSSLTVVLHRPDLTNMEVVTFLSERVAIRDFEARSASIESVLRKLYRSSPDEKRSVLAVPGTEPG